MIIPFKGLRLELDSINLQNAALTYLEAPGNHLGDLNSLTRIGDRAAEERPQHDGDHAAAFLRYGLVMPSSTREKQVLSVLVDQTWRVLRDHVDDTDLVERLAKLHGHPHVIPRTKRALTTELGKFPRKELWYYFWCNNNNWRKLARRELDITGLYGMGAIVYPLIKALEDVLVQGANPRIFTLKNRQLLACVAACRALLGQVEFKEGEQLVHRLAKAHLSRFGVAADEAGLLPRRANQVPPLDHVLLFSPICGESCFSLGLLGHRPRDTRRLRSTERFIDGVVARASQNLELNFRELDADSIRSLCPVKQRAVYHRLSALPSADAETPFQPNPKFNAFTRQFGEVVPRLPDFVEVRQFLAAVQA